MSTKAWAIQGVISSSTNGSSLSIKNKIIEQAISEKWLSEVERSEQSVLEYADSHFWAGRYAEAISAYEEYAKAGGEDLDPDQHRLNRARSYYIVGRYSDAIAELDGNLFPKSRSFDNYSLSLSTLAASYLSVARYSESIPLYERYIKELVVVKDPLGVDGCAPLDLHRAQLSLSNACLALDPPNLSRAKELCETVVLSLSKVGETGDEMVDRLRSLAHYNLHKVAFKTDCASSAIEELDLAIASANNSDRAVLLLEKAVNSVLKSERIAALGSCVEHCLNCQVQLSELRVVERPLSFKLAAAAQLAYELAALEADMTGVLDRFVGYCNDPAIGHEVDVFRVIMLAARYAISIRRDEIAMRLYAKAALLESDSRTEERFFISSTAILIAKEEELDAVSGFFLETAILSSPLDGIPLAACHRMINKMINEGDDGKSMEVLRSLVPGGYEGNDLGDLDGCINAFLMLRASGDTFSQDELFAKVVALHGAVMEAVPSQGSFYARTHSKVIASQIMRAFPSFFALKTIQRAGRKYSRNDIVRVRLRDGSVTKGKYKKFQDDIASGAAEVFDIE